MPSFAIDTPSSLAAAVFPPASQPDVPPMRATTIPVAAVGNVPGHAHATAENVFEPGRSPIDLALAPVRKHHPALVDDVWDRLGEFGEQGEMALLARLGGRRPWETPRQIIERFCSQAYRHAFWRSMEHHGDAEADLEDIQALVNATRMASLNSQPPGPLPCYKVSNALHASLLALGNGFQPVDPGMGRRETPPRARAGALTDEGPAGQLAPVHAHAASGPASVATSVLNVLGQWGSAIDRHVNLFDQAGAATLAPGPSGAPAGSTGGADVPMRYDANVAVLKRELEKIIRGGGDVSRAVRGSFVAVDPRSPLGVQVEAFKAAVDDPAVKAMLDPLIPFGDPVGIGRTPSRSSVILVFIVKDAAWSWLPMRRSLGEPGEHALAMALAVDPSGQPVRIDGKVSLPVMLASLGLASEPCDTADALKGILAKLPAAPPPAPGRPPSTSVPAMPPLEAGFFVTQLVSVGHAAGEHAPVAGGPTLCDGLTAAGMERALARIKGTRAIASPDDLFDVLGMAGVCIPAFGAIPQPKILRDPAAAAWRTLVAGDAFKAFAKAVARELNWVDPASPWMLETLGRAAISRYLFPPEARVPGHVLDVDLWGTAELGLGYGVLYDRSLGAIARKFPNSSPAVIDLLADVFLGEVAPELLIADVPSYITGRSLEGVGFLHGMALLDGVAPGASQGKTFSVLVATPATIAAGNGTDLHDAWGEALAKPALRYAKAHGAIDFANLRDVTPAQVNKAIELVRHDQKSSADDLQRLLTPRPDRQSMAIDVLRESGLPEPYWHTIPGGHEVKVMLESYGLTTASGYAWDRSMVNIGNTLGDAYAPQSRPVEATILQRVMMGELNGASTVPDLYDAAFRRFREAATLGMSNIVNRLLRELSASDRSRLASATCEVSRVTLDDLGNAYHGIFLRCQPGDHRDDFDEHKRDGEFYVELFPMAGAVRSSHQVFNYHRRNERSIAEVMVVSAEVRDEHEREAKLKDRFRPLNPLDSDAYLTGTVSRDVETPVHPARGVLVPAEKLVYTPAGQSEGIALSTLSVAVAEQLLGAQLDEAKKTNAHDTEWEKIWKQERSMADTVARLVLPFYACAEDLSQGKHSGGVIAGCAIDMAFALIPMGEFVGSTARIVARAGELVATSLCEEMAGALGKLATSLARQSTVSGVVDLTRGVRWFAKGSWEELKVFFGERGMLPGGPVVAGEPVVVFDGLHHAVPEGQAAGWSAAHPGQTADRVDGVPHVLTGKTAEGKPYAIDPENDQLYGPPLAIIGRDGSLSSHVLPTIPVSEANGRRLFEDKATWPGKSWLVDIDSGSVTLQSDGMTVARYRSETLGDGSSVLRKIDDPLARRTPKALEPVSCRTKRGVEELVPCDTGAGLFQTPGFTTSIDAPGVRDYVTWFGQERIAPAAGSQAFVRDGKIFTVKNHVPTVAAAGDMPSLGADIAPRYRERISATIMGGSDDFKRIRIDGGLDERIADSREVSAVVADHDGTGKRWLVTEADTGQFYVGEVPESGPVPLRKVDIGQEVLEGTTQPFTDEENLVVIMRGSQNANAQRLMYPEPQVLEKSLANLERLLSSQLNDRYLLGRGNRFRLATTDAEAVMFAPHPRIAFNALVDARLGWPHGLPVDAAVLEANGKFYADALDKFVKKPGLFSPVDFTTAEGAKKAVLQLQKVNGMKDSAVARVTLSDGATEVHYAGFGELEATASQGPRWLSADRYAADPYVTHEGLSLPPLSPVAGTRAPVARGSVESQVFNAIYRDHPNPGTVVDVKLWVAGRRDAAAPFFYQEFTNPGVQLRIFDPATHQLMADVPEMTRLTPESWRAMDKSALPEGVETQFDDDLTYGRGIPYVYSWKNGRKSYVAWVQDEKTLFSREGEGATWSIPERYDYRATGTWHTPTGAEPTLKTTDVEPGRDQLVPERLKRAKQAIQDGVLLPPIKVRSLGEGKYAIVDGNHRLQAARDLGLANVPYILQ